MSADNIPDHSNIKNKPYVKQKDEEGNILNPIRNKIFRTPFPNRRTRRNKR